MWLPRLFRKQSSDSEKFFIRNGEMLLRLQISFSKELVSPIRVFTFSELAEATDNFDVSRRFDRDGFCSYYSAALDGRGVVVRVPESRREAIENEIIEGFLTEIVILSNIRHKNVVKLLGCCLETQLPLLVHEPFPKGNLDHNMRLWANRRSDALPWSIRLQIAIDVADAVHYLHRYTSRPIVHKDLKPSHVGLDEDYTAKLTGFMFSVPIPLGETEVEDRAVFRTYCFLDPEYIRSGVVTVRVDVFAFGVLLLELLTGERPMRWSRQGDDFLLELLPRAGVQGFREAWLADLLAGAAAPEDAEGTTQRIGEIAELALRCADPRSQERPTMKEVVEELRRRMTPVVLP